MSLFSESLTVTLRFGGMIEVLMQKNGNYTWGSRNPPASNGSAIHGSYSWMHKQNKAHEPWISTLVDILPKTVCSLLQSVETNVCNAGNGDWVDKYMTDAKYMGSVNPHLETYTRMKEIANGAPTIISRDLKWELICWAWAALALLGMAWEGLAMAA